MVVEECRYASKGAMGNTGVAISYVSSEYTDIDSKLGTTLDL